jgi:membrane protease subunit HflK
MKSETDLPRPPSPPGDGEEEQPLGAAPPPPSVRIIRGAVAWAAKRRGAVAAGGLAVIGAAWLATGFYAVGNGESAAVSRFGRLTDDTVGPGLHLALPEGIDGVVQEQTGEIKRLEVTATNGERLALVTGDENLIEIALTVQYRITALGRYLYSAEQPQALLSQSVRSALVQAVAGMPVDDLLTSGKAQIQNEVRETAQGQLESYGAGLSLLSVNLQVVSPPAEAADAFLQVNDAKARAAQAINEAEGRRDSALTLARGEAEQSLAEARAGAERRTGEARGQADRFTAVLAQERRTPDQTRSDFYLAMARNVLPKVRIVVLAPGEVPRVDVNILTPRPSPP